MHSAPPPKANIALVIRGLTPYWTEAIDALACSWREFGTVTVITGGLWKSDLHPWNVDAIQLRHASVTLCPAHRRLRLMGTAWPDGAIWRELDQLDPQIVLVHEYSPYVLLSGFLWAKANKRPCIVISDVGPIQKRELNPLQRIVHSLVNLSVDGVLARTVDALDFGRIYHKNSLLSPHAINTQMHAKGALRVANPRAPRRFIQVGSLVHRKGVDLLLKAFQNALSVRGDLELILVGSGDHRSVYGLAKELGIERNVIIKDFLQPTALAEEYANADVFVLASRFDSYGVVVHEAAAAALPLVVSRFAGASATLIKDGINGFQVDPRDIDGFSEALLKTIDSVNYPRFCKASLEIAETYDVIAVANRTVNWLRTFIGRSLLSPPPKQGIFIGIARALSSIISSVSSSFRWPAEMDPFDIDKREIVIVQRYLPIYRESIFMRIASVWSTRVLYSGKTLGNLQTAERIESRTVGSFEIRRDNNEPLIVWLRLSGQLIASRPELVCTEMSLSLLSTWWLFIMRILLGFKIVFWTHGLQNYGWKDRSLNFADQVRLVWIKMADAIVFYSDDRKADVEDITGRSPKYFVAPNTHDTADLERVYQHLYQEGRTSVRSRLGVAGPTLVYIGRLTKDKDVLRLADILKGTDHISNPPNMIIIGGGELESDLRKSCQPFIKRVRFIGSVFDPLKKGEWIYSADLMVSPGYVGLNVVDSLAMGTPLATLGNAALIKRHSPEVTYLKEGVNAIFSPDITCLCHAIVRWIDDGSGISGTRPSIRELFLKSSSQDQQFEGLRKAFDYVTDTSI